MESPTERHGHLDATAGREVVYCHACSHEWYRDEHGLTCPRADCGSDVTEIVSPDNDPRDFENPHHSSASTSPELPSFRYRGDSDPDEADIEEHLGPQGFVFRRSVRDSTQGGHHNPGIEPVLERFIDMVHTFGAQRGTNPDASPGQEPQRRFGEPHFHRAIFTSNTAGGGTASVTIVSGPSPRSFGDGQQGGADPFQAYEPPPPPQPESPGPRRVVISMVIIANQRPSIFANVLRDVGPPNAGQQGGPPAGLARSLQDILSLFNPGNAIAGDAVYTQEALDRIISNLMEANPQSNAAPPASEEALEKLERRVVDAELRGQDDKFDCSVCIDEMKIGDTIISLPCKHIFHEECVVAWLKEHNTCPVCRAPVEKSAPRERPNQSDSGQAGGGDGSAEGSGPPPIPGDRPSFAQFQSLGSGANPWSHNASPNPEADSGSPAAERPFRYSRPPSHSQSMLNEAMRSISSRQFDRQRDRERERDRGETSGFSYDTSRLQRRSSMSPTSPRIAPGEQGSRIRQRSPSESSSSRRSAREGDSRRQSGIGPLSWLRDRFSGSGGNGNDPNRDDRRG